MKTKETELLQKCWSEVFEHKWKGYNDRLTRTRRFKTWRRYDIGRELNEKLDRLENLLKEEVEFATVQLWNVSWRMLTAEIVVELRLRDTKRQCLNRGCKKWFVPDDSDKYICSACREEKL
jgi:hypothetical protein